MILLILTGITQTLIAQNTASDSSIGKPSEVCSIGAVAGWNITTLHGSFQPVDTAQSLCGSFTDGSGSGAAFGVVFELPLSDKFRLCLMPLYLMRSGTMSFQCVDPARTRLPNGTIVPAITEFVAEVDLSSLTLRSTLDYQPFRFPLWVSLGGSTSLNMSNGISRREQIVSPSNATFVDGGGQVLNLKSLDSDTSNISVGLLAGIRYRLPVSDKMTLVPELHYDVVLNDQLTTSSLRSNQLRALLSLEYRIETVPPLPPPPVVKRDTAPPPSPRLTSRIGVLSQNADAETVTDTVLVSRKFIVNTQLYPLLPYLFFDNSSSTLHTRYLRRTEQEATGFTEQRHLKGLKTLGIYYNVLDIIGSRMKSYPDAVLTITGTQPDAGGKAPLSLADARSAVIRDYLATVWHIPASRLRIVTRRDPQTPSSTDTQDGVAENRRVELSSNRYEITAPVVLTDTIWKSSSASLQILPTVSAEAGVRIWNVSITARGNQIAEYNGTGNVPALLSHQLDSVLSALSIIPDNLETTLSVQDSVGQTNRTTSQIPVRRRTQDIPTAFTGSYSLILFDFDKATLRAEHNRTIDFINQHTVSASRLDVYGFTDRLGEADRNTTLSDSRARSVAGKLQASVGEVIGKGESEELYDNNLPEGRFYCRSVTVVVR